MSDGRLVVAGTPLGRITDASSGLISLLESADVIAAEDTRRLARLAADLGFRPTGQVVSYYEAVEAQRIPALIERMTCGATVALVTDAGMPCVSDPGYRLVAAAAAAGVTVTSVPGPSAAITALALSGLPSDRFCFEGFLPRRSGPRDRALAALATEMRTMIFFESVHRLTDTLAALVAAFGAARSAVLTRELTKTYEDIRRGTLGSLLAGAQDVRGEVTLVVAGASAVSAAVSMDHAAAEVAALMDAGDSRRDAVATVAGRYGLAKRQVYQASLTL